MTNVVAFGRLRSAALRAESTLRLSQAEPAAAIAWCDVADGNASASVKVRRDPFGPCNRGEKDAKPEMAGGITPSERFLKLTRNPDLEPPARFVPTVKKPGDVVL